MIDVDVHRLESSSCGYEDVRGRHPSRRLSFFDDTLRWMEAHDVDTHMASRRQRLRDVSSASAAGFLIVSRIPFFPCSRSSGSGLTPAAPTTSMPGTSHIRVFSFAAFTPTRVFSTRVGIEARSQGCRNLFSHLPRTACPYFMARGAGWPGNHG